MTWSLTLIYVCKSPAKIMVKKNERKKYTKHYYLIQDIV